MWSEYLSVKLRQRRLRWLAYVKRAESCLLNEVEEVMISGRQPVGRSKKKWRAWLIEDMNTFRIGNTWYKTASCGRQWSPIQPHCKWETWD